MTGPVGDGETRAVGRLLVTPRTLRDYRDMFALTDDDLGGPILDCAAGAASFAAQVRLRGGTVVSADPAYRQSPDELLAQVRRDIEHVYAWAGTQDATFNWTYLGSPEALRRAFDVAADFFAADFLAADMATNRRWYVPEELPHLPYPDGHFRLALCSHLLFCYPEYLSVADHVAGLLELVRVTRGEVRVYPLVDTTATVYEHLDTVRDTLAEGDVRSEIRPAASAWLNGGDQMLVCWRPRTDEV